MENMVRSCRKKSSLLLVQACDMFEVVRLEKAFVAAHKEAFAADPVITEDIVDSVT